MGGPAGSDLPTGGLGYRVKGQWRFGTLAVYITILWCSILLLMYVSNIKREDMF